METPVEPYVLGEGRKYVREQAAFKEQQAFTAASSDLGLRQPAPANTISQTFHTELSPVRAQAWHKAKGNKLPREGLLTTWTEEDKQLYLGLHELKVDASGTRLSGTVKNLVPAETEKHVLACFQNSAKLAFGNDYNQVNFRFAQGDNYCAIRSYSLWGICLSDEGGI